MGTDPSLPQKQNLTSQQPHPSSSNDDDDLHKFE